MEGDIGAEVEDPLGGGAVFPGGGEAGDELDVGVVVGEGVEDVALDAEGGGFEVVVGVHGEGVGALVDADGEGGGGGAGGWGLGGGGGGIASAGGEEEEGEEIAEEEAQGLGLVLALGHGVGLRVRGVRGDYGRRGGGMQQFGWGGWGAGSVTGR